MAIRPYNIYMPAIDLARLRKQTSRLVDFFFVPDEFLRHLREILDYYVNRTLRTVEAVAPGSNLSTYHTSPVILRQIELELAQVASNSPAAALDLADLLWDEGYLETCLLAAFLLGRIPPQEEQSERLLARLTAWTQQVRDPSVRVALLTTSLARLRQETPKQFLELIGEWLHPARTRTWSNGIQALLPLLTDPGFENLPPVLNILEPVFESAPATLQVDLGDLILALYKKSPTETTFFLRQLLSNPENQMTNITLRRLSSLFPEELLADLRDLLRARPASSTPTGG
ncbi:MAG TPA: DNA alkylation repair protein [Anaerolineales bacterium]|nr:DNA alkylation repair protein [Anaerolineales bacterium]